MFAVERGERLSSVADMLDPVIQRMQRPDQMVRIFDIVLDEEQVQAHSSLSKNQTGFCPIEQNCAGKIVPSVSLWNRRDKGGTDSVISPRVPRAYEPD